MTVLDTADQHQQLQQQPHLIPDAEHPAQVCPVIVTQCSSSSSASSGSGSRVVSK